MNAVAAMTPPDPPPAAANDTGEMTCRACGEITADLVGACVHCGAQLPDYDETVDFLRRLDFAAKGFTFQAFDDSKEKRGQLAQTINERPRLLLLDRMARLNAQGAGVFVTINKTNGRGRRADNVLAVRALFVDLDGAPVAPVLAASLRPHIVVESSPGKYHAYWLVSDCPLDEFKRWQQALARLFGGDRSVCDLPRVLRLPGFLHQKGEPFRTRLLRDHCHDAPPYRLAEIIAQLGLTTDGDDDRTAKPGKPSRLTPSPEARRAALARVDAATLDDLENALQALPKEQFADPRDKWIEVGMHLKSVEGAAGDDDDRVFAMWIAFSERGDTFDYDEAVRVWESFNPERCTHRSIFRWAQEAGWVNPRRGQRPAGNASDFENLDAQAGQPATLSYVDFASLAHGDPPARRWVVDQWLPRKTVTALFGRGGHGKSLLSEQLAFTVTNGVKFLGLEVTRGPVLGIFCEDDGDELLRRGKAIASALFLQPGEGVADLHLDARAGKENMLVAFGPDNRANVQALLVAMRTEIERVRPVLVIFDNIAQLFGGLENSRIQVTAFCNLLTAVAVDYDAAVLLLGHLAKAEGSEYSGSTGWDAAVRSRLLLERLDDGTSVLKKLKANYAATDEIRLEFRDGAFHRVVGSAGDAAALAGLKSQIIAAIETYTAREQAVSHITTARNNLIKLMTDDGLLAEGSRRAARLALTALIDSGSVLVNRERSWKSTGRHKVFGLSLAPAHPQGNLAEICTVDAGEMPGDLTGTGGG